MTIDIEDDNTAPAPLEGLDEIAAALVAQARADGLALTGDGGLLAGLMVSSMVAGACVVSGPIVSVQY